MNCAPGAEQAKPLTYFCASIYVVASKGTCFENHAEFKLLLLMNVVEGLKLIVSTTCYRWLQAGFAAILSAGATLTLGAFSGFPMAFSYWLLSQMMDCRRKFLNSLLLIEASLSCSARRGCVDVDDHL